MKKVLALTVGTGRQGQPADPIVYAIQREHPDYIIFFVTKESKEITLPKVLERIEKGTDTYEICLCDDENDVIECYKIFKSKLKELILSNLTNPSRMVVDYTTGTKAMSAALVMAGTSMGVDCLNYIAGRRENGIVISGTERSCPIMPTELYWEHFHNQVIENFNSYRFNECLATIEKMLTMTMESDKQEMALFLKNLSESYLAWDLFSINDAFNGLKKVKNHKMLETYGCKGRVKQNLEFLHREIDGEEYSTEKAVDLYYNARRRFTEGRFDDCVARLYRLLEYMAQAKLHEVSGIDTSDVDILKIDEKCSGLVADKKSKGKTVISLFTDYRLLSCLGDPLGKEFDKQIIHIKKVLSARNNSILAHGFHPVGKKCAESMFDIIQPLFELFLGKPVSKLKGSEFPKLRV